MGATAKIDIADPIAHGDEPLDAIIRDVAAVAQVKKVQIFAETRDGVDGSVGQVATLLEHKVP
jgi:hypothetical protein